MENYSSLGLCSGQTPHEIFPRRMLYTHNR